jgi:putative secretion ATPase (PEP-CTERM system associated)
MYEAFYGLSGKPFQLSPDPSFYFGSKGHTSAYAYLKYGVYQGEGFLVITGEVGAGKTTLVRALLEELDAASIVAAQIVSTQLEADDLLRSVAKAFGIRAAQDDKATLIASIEAFLLMLYQQGKRALLVIDEAQNLNAGAIEELRMLSNFQYGDHALLQSFLVGQPELRHLMRSPAMEQFRQRVIASYHLGPLDEEETRGYVEHRLNRVSWKGDPAFDASAIHAIHAASGGIPRRINALANRLMLAGFLAGQHAFTAAEVDAVASELSTELGPQAVSQPARDAPSRAPLGDRPDLVGNVRRLLTMADRVDRLERDVQEVMALVRVLVEPERALPDEDAGRSEPPKRKRKSGGAS